MKDTGREGCSERKDGLSHGGIQDRKMYKLGTEYWGKKLSSVETFISL